jgi:hypothetical protein
MASVCEILIYYANDDVCAQTFFAKASKWVTTTILVKWIATNNEKATSTDQQLQTFQLICQKCVRTYQKM